MSCHGTDKDVPTIARELGVRYMLEGSVRRAANAIRVTAQLIEAERDDHKWSGKFSGSVEDVFEIQERLSREIVDALKVTLTPEDAEKMTGRLAGQLANNPALLDLYMKLRHEIWRMSPDGVARARAIVEEAESLVEENALLLAAKANVLFQTHNLGVEIDESLVSDAEALARKALALDPDCSQANAVMGWILTSSGKAIDALPYIARASELDPSDSETRVLAIMGPTFTGRGDPAALEAQARELLASDPLTPLNHFAMALQLMLRGSFDEAAEALRRVRKLDPSSAYSFFLGLAMSELGRTTEALEAFAPLAEHPEATTWNRMGAAWWRALRGETAEARALMTSELLSWARPDVQYPWHMAQIYCLIGDLDDALDWLGTAINNGFLNYTFLAEHERLLDPLRQEPRFAELLERVRTKSHNTH